MQQVKANVVVFDGGVELNRDGDQTEGEDAAGDGPSHPARVSCHWRADLRVKLRSGLDREKEQVERASRGHPLAV